MSNVIRPAFGDQSKPAVRANGERIENFTVLQDYGAAGGHKVGLIRINEGSGASSLCVLVGREDSDRATTVVILPDTADGEATAETVGLAVLRALGIASEPPPPI